MSIARGTTVRYARRRAAAPATTMSARQAGMRIPARRATVVAAISSRLFDAQGAVPERLVLVEVRAEREAHIEDLREVVQVRDLRVSRDAAGRLDRLLTVQ